MIAEWAYNIHDACKKFRGSFVDAMVFFDTLMGVKHEEVHMHLYRILQHLKSWLHSLAATQATPTSSNPSKDAIILEMKRIGLDYFIGGIIDFGGGSAIRKQGEVKVAVGADQAAESLRDATTDSLQLIYKTLSRSLDGDQSGATLSVDLLFANEVDSLFLESIKDLSMRVIQDYQQSLEVCQTKF